MDDASQTFLPSTKNETGPSLTTGVLVDGVFWRFDDTVTAAAIAWEATRQKVRKLVTMFVIAIAVCSIALFAFGVVTVFGEDILTTAMWWQPNAYLALPWIAVLCAALLYYRTTHTRLDVVSVPRPKSNPEFVTLPSLDAVESHMNIAHVLDSEARRVIDDAFVLAVRAGHADVTALHIFAAALATRPVAMVFARLGLSYEDIKDPLRRKIATCAAGETVFGGVAHEILDRAFMLAIADRRSAVSPLEIFTAAVVVEPFFEDLFASKAVTREALTNVFAWIRMNDDLYNRYRTFRRLASFKPTGAMNRAYTAIATPFLDSVSEDLTAAAVQGRTEMLIGREREMADVMRTIEGGNQSIVLVGEEGVGKAAIIEGIAERMVAEDVPAVLADKRLLKLSVPHIVSAQGGNGAEERFLYAMEQVAATGNVILVIENIHELVGAGETIDLSSILSGELEKGYTFVIATTTAAGYRAIETSPLKARVAKIVVNEPERNDAIMVLESKMGFIEARNKVIFTYNALEAVVDLSMRYMHDAMLPQKAITLAKEVALDVAKRGGVDAHVTKEHVAKLVGAKTGVPTTDVSQEEGDKLLHLEERMHERIVGQAHAVKAIAAALRRARVELRSTKRPIANFLFLGPTGVGKTELAKTTAAVFFNDEKAMIRFDMSEYQDAASSSRLIGGNGQAGLLTEAVRKQPFALLLLDELEKAHPDILNLFLQVMDDGRLTDGTGRTVDFTNVILIATSNAGTQFIQDRIAQGETVDTIKTALLETELRSVYKPEFLNRFDDTIVFTPLTQEDVVAIAHLMLNGVVAQMKEKGITFEIADDAIVELAQKGFDPKFGARPLRRAIQENVENAIAEFLLKGNVGRRDTLVMEKGDVITVHKAEEL